MAEKKLKNPKANYSWKSEAIVNVTDSTLGTRDKVNQLDDISVQSCSGVSKDDASASDVGRLMYKLFVEQLYTDVIFTPKNGKDSISAHRAVLAAKSEFFVDLLFGTKRHEAKSMEMRVAISSLDFSAFKSIIEYLYTDDIELTDVSTVLEIYIGAKKFQIECLIERCESYIEFLELTEENVCSILQMCNDEILEELKNKCIAYIQENTDKVISSADFEKCTYNAIHTVCNLSSLCLKSEVQLLDAVVRWIKNQPLHTKPGILRPLLSSIRFLTSRASEFGAIIKNYPDIMTADDALKIMIFLNDSSQTRNMENLPAWCNTNMQRRCIGQRNANLGAAGIKPKIPKNVYGKISVSLKPSAEPQEIFQFFSVLTMECIQGRHEINTMKISFQDLPLNEHIVLFMSVTIHRLLRLVFTRKESFVMNRKEKVKYFKPPIRVFRGQVISFNVKAVGSTSLKLFQLQKNQDSLQNEHFQCNVRCQPEDKKLFFLSEMQYGSQNCVYFKPHRANNNIK